MSEETVTIGRRLREKLGITKELDALAIAVLQALNEYHVPWPRQLLILEKLPELVKQGMLTLADGQYLCTSDGWYHVDTEQQITTLTEAPCVLLSINLSRLQRILEHAQSVEK